MNLNLKSFLKSPRLLQGTDQFGKTGSFQPPRQQVVRRNSHVKLSNAPLDRGRDPPPPSVRKSILGDDFHAHIDHHQGSNSGLSHITSIN